MLRVLAETVRVRIREDAGGQTLVHDPAPTRDVTGQSRVTARTPDARTHRIAGAKARFAIDGSDEATCGGRRPDRQRAGRGDIAARNAGVDVPRRDCSAR